MFIQVHNNTIDDELDNLLSVVNKSSNNKLKILYENKNTDISLRVKRMQWHIDGVIYHYRNMKKYYYLLSKDVAMRVSPFEDGSYPSALLFYDAIAPNLYHELYAFINLYRISIDMFIKLLHHQFTNKKSLPKSINKFKSNESDCGVLKRIAKDSFVNYFIDLRNCINHYRSFAVGNNIVAFSEDLNDDERKKIGRDDEIWLQSEFRIENQGVIVYNIYLPDSIYENKQHDVLVKNFTFDEKKNLLSYSLWAIRQMALSYVESLELIGSDNYFTYSSNINTNEEIKYRPITDYFDVFSLPYKIIPLY